MALDQGECASRSLLLARMPGSLPRAIFVSQAIDTDSEQHKISQEINDHYGGKHVNFATFLLAPDPLHFEQNSWFYRPRSVTA